jgi:putative transposase
MGSDRTFTAKEIAEITGKTKRAIEMRAIKEVWHYIEENGNGRGGKTKKYPLSALPSDVQSSILIYIKDTNGENSPAAIAQTMEMLPALRPSAALLAMDHLSNFQTFEDAFKPANTLAASVGNKGNRTPPTPERMAAMDRAGREYAALRRDDVRVKMKIIHQALKMPDCWDKGRRPWIEKVAKDNKTSFQNVYKMMGKYKRGGAAALEHTKSNGGEPRVWTKEALNWWIGMALKKGHDKISLRVLYEDALVVEAHRNGWDIGCYESALGWFRLKATPQMRALQTGGVGKLDNTMVPIMRDYSDLKPFQILCGDQHRLDFWVQDAETGEVFRPECFIWQDLRTRVIYGAAIVRDYSADTVGLALRIGLNIFGLFDSVYTDHGKPEESKYIMGIRKELAGLDVHFKESVEYYDEIIAGADAEEVQPLMRLPHQHVQAVVRNAKAKMAESTNRAIEIILTSKFRIPGHVKDLRSDQEDQFLVDQRNKKLAIEGKLLTFEEIAIKFYQALDYYNQEHNHRGVKKEWHWDMQPEKYTPFACLKMCWQDGWRPRRVAESSLELVFLSRTERTPKNGVITFDNDYYQNNELAELPEHTRVELRFDPFDNAWLAVFKDGKYFCTAWLVEFSSMKDLTLAQRKIMEKRKLRKAFTDQYKLWTSKVPDFIVYSEVPKEDKAAALIGQARKQKAIEMQEKTRVLTEEELGAGLRLAEERNRIPKAKPGAPLPAKPTHWTSLALRHDWCLKVLASGGEIETEDRQWMLDYESTMTPEARARWEFERECNAAEAQ